MTPEGYQRLMCSLSTIIMTEKYKTISKEYNFYGETLLLSQASRAVCLGNAKDGS